jgi:hypothetical protein
VGGPVQGRDLRVASARLRGPQRGLIIGLALGTGLIASWTLRWLFQQPIHDHPRAKTPITRAPLAAPATGDAKHRDARPKIPTLDESRSTKPTGTG